jgi:peptidoglycan/xylan/chitin deacetylase (PgdA/CDA1 family)
LHWKQHEKNPKIFQTIISEGHTIGNHTYHLNGWKTTTASYLANVALCEETIQKNSNYSLKQPFALHTEK